MAFNKQHIKRHRYAPNNLTLWTPPLLAIIFISIYIAAPRLYRANRLAHFTIYNGENPYYPNPEYFDCLVLLDKDTIFQRKIGYWWEAFDYVTFKRELAKGNHILEVHNLLYDVIEVDTLQIKTSDRDEFIDISYEHIDQAEVDMLNVVFHGKDYRQKKDIDFYKPKDRRIFIRNHTANHLF